MGQANQPDGLEADLLQAFARDDAEIQQWLIAYLDCFVDPDEPLLRWMETEFARVFDTTWAELHSESQEPELEQSQIGE